MSTAPPSSEEHGDTGTASQLHHHSRRPLPSGSLAQSKSARNIHVSGLPPCVNDEQLQRLFSEFGDIVAAKVMMDVKTATSKGFGFVLFKSEESGQAAIAVMNGRTMTIQGSDFTIKCNVSQHDGVHALAESNSIYVRSVPDRISSLELKEYFSQFGLVHAQQAGVWKRA